MAFQFKPAIRLCRICNKEFYPPKQSRPGIYCSAVCRNTGNSRASAQRRGEMQRGSGSKTYVKENGVHQHRLVAEKMLGRKLVKGEIVHHKDGNKKNNAENNLEVMTQAEHMKAHGMAIKGNPLKHKPWEFRGK